uniref:Uncharacterized protein n=1 Tax=viral metagenome TaxID=1070528 RepID=A0A6H1ZNA5_9ZZZZ
MCNKIHTNRESRVRKIKPEGMGWKLFEQSETTPVELLSLVSLIQYENCSQDGWVLWRSKRKCATEAGFCFFRTKKDAETASVNWYKYARCAKNVCIRKIKYSGGLVTQIEHGFVGRAHPIRMGLCKSFKVID